MVKITKVKVNEENKKYTESELKEYENELKIIKQMNITEELEILKSKLENTEEIRQCLQQIRRAKTIFL